MFGALAAIVGSFKKKPTIDPEVEVLKKKIASIEAKAVNPENAGRKYADAERFKYRGYTERSNIAHHYANGFRDGVEAGKSTQ